MAAPLLLGLLVLYVAPVLNVLWISVNDPEPGFGNYEKLAHVAGMRRVLWTTLRISAETTLIGVPLAYLVAWTMLHAGPRHRLWMLGFVLIPFWVSVLVRAFAWLTLLRTEGLINRGLIGAGLISQPLALVYNEFGVLVGMVHYLIPYAVLPLLANMQGIDRRLVPASRSLGAGPLTSFLRIFLPLSGPGIAAACLLVFILALGFLVTPAVLGGGRVMMISEYVRLQIFQTVRWGVGTMMASCLLIAVLVAIMLLSRAVDVRRLFAGA
jgi:putative spermidine/putrescine transport system permease protein